MFYPELEAQQRAQYIELRLSKEMGLFQKSFVMVKPQNLRLIPEIGSFIEKSGLEIVGGKSLNVSKKQVEEIYKVHQGQAFYSSLVTCTVGEVFLFEVVGNDAVTVVREEVISKVRQRFGINPLQDVVHAPDSLDAYQKETRIFSL